MLDAYIIDWLKKQEEEKRRREEEGRRIYVPLPPPELPPKPLDPKEGDGTIVIELTKSLYII